MSPTRSDSGFDEASHREDLYQVLFEANPLPMYVLAAGDASFLAVNGAAVRHYGYSRDELLAMTLLDLSADEDGDDLLAQVGRARSEPSGMHRVGARRQRAKNGTVLDVDLYCSRLAFQGTEAILALANDVTERQMAEAALWASEAQMRGILDNALDAVVGMDAHGRIVSWNGRSEAIFGWSREQAVGRVLAELVIPERFREGHARGIARFLATGEGPVLNRRIEMSALRRDGSEFPVDLSITALRQGGDYVFSAFIADITDRRAAQDALRASERRFRGLIENSADAIALVAADGRILYGSPACTRILGYPLESFVGRNAFDLSHPDDRPFVRLKLEESLRRPRAGIDVWARVLHENGSWRYLEGIFTNLLDEPSVAAIVSNFRDTTERRRLEERLRQSQKIEAVGRLAGGIAHDFNNLLTVILGNGDLLLRRLGAEDPGRRHLDQIRKAAESAASLTRQLLAFGRKQMFEVEVLDLGELVEALGALLRRLIPESIQIRTVLGPGPKGVRADRGQIEQVVVNLAVNASEAMAQGGVLEVEVRPMDVGPGAAPQPPDVEPGPYVLLTVRDTGLGMDAATRSHLFEPFFTTKERGRGSGLSLATVHGIVKQSGGHIFVESEPERGTTFSIYLPRTEAPPKQAAPAAPVVEGAIARGRETVLLVEDQEGLRGLATEVLEESGYRVLPAASGAEALRLASGHEGAIQLLLTDVVMPEMGGPEVASRLGETRPGVKVLYMSGYTDDELAERGLTEGGRAFIQKPFEPDALVRKVRSILDALRGS